ncbi:MAG: hypothetical protein ACRCU2_13115 [Planktothrix sp.]
MTQDDRNDISKTPSDLAAYSQDDLTVYARVIGGRCSNGPLVDFDLSACYGEGSKTFPIFQDTEYTPVTDSGLMNR